MISKRPTIAVIGSINLDFVATGASLPAPGETVTGATLARHPGGKGANQALAARRLGADVALFGRVGADAMADDALALLTRAGVDLKGVIADAKLPTGVALIAVNRQGENQIVVAAGANAALSAADIPAIDADAIICQLETPIEATLAAAEKSKALLVANLAPAAAVPDAVFTRAGLIIVNETEAAAYGAQLDRATSLVAVTLGARGVVLKQAGREIASASPPKVSVVDTTGAGDTFVGAITVALLEGMAHAQALAFACAAGALTATRAGAQTSLPSRAEVDALIRGS